MVYLDLRVVISERNSDLKTYWTRTKIWTWIWLLLDLIQVWYLLLMFLVCVRRPRWTSQIITWASLALRVVSKDTLSLNVTTPWFEGEQLLKNLREQFDVDFKKTLTGFRDFIDNGGSHLPDTLQDIISAFQWHQLMLSAASAPWTSSVPPFVAASVSSAYRVSCSLVLSDHRWCSSIRYRMLKSGWHMVIQQKETDFHTWVFRHCCLWKPMHSLGHSCNVNWLEWHFVLYESYRVAQKFA